MFTRTIKLPGLCLHDVIISLLPIYIYIYINIYIVTLSRIRTGNSRRDGLNIKRSLFRPERERETKSGTHYNIEHTYAFKTNTKCDSIRSFDSAGSPIYSSQIQIGNTLIYNQIIRFRPSQADRFLELYVPMMESKYFA